MNTAELDEYAMRSAIAFFTSHSPEDWTTGEILEAIEQGNDSVVVWEPFEYWDTYSIVNSITDMKESLMVDFTHVIELTGGTVTP